MVRRISAIALCVGLGMFGLTGCAKTDSASPVAPGVTTEVWQGKLFDATMKAILTAAQMPYDSTVYRYSLVSDNSYKLEMNIGVGWATSEKGTYTKTATEASFVVDSNFVSNATTHQMQPATAKRANYSGTVSGTTIAFATYMSIADAGQSYPQGALTITKQ